MLLGGTLELHQQAMMVMKKTSSRIEGTLNDVTILLVEDEYYIADDFRRTIEAAGGRVVGPVSTVDRALAMVNEHNFDCAIIDVNLHGQSAAPVVDRLVAEGRPFAVATGYGSSSVPVRLKHVPCIEKPFGQESLISLISDLLKVSSKSHEDRLP